MNASRARFLLAFFSVALASLLAPAALHAADSVSVQATLILGSNEGQGVEGSLKQYERNLKKVLPFDTFKRQGSGRASVDLPGSSTISMGSGHSVKIDAQPAGDGKYRITARWSKGGQTYINTTIVAAKGRPTVLVGPSASGGRLILLLVAS